jgi:hypothetical protein
MKIISVLVIGVGGFIGGWAARSLADSPQGAGVKLLEIAMNAKKRVGRWAAVEGERLEDMFAEARSKAEPEFSRSNGATNGSVSKGRSMKTNGSVSRGRSMNKRARQDPGLVKREAGAPVGKGEEGA